VESLVLVAVLVLFSIVLAATPSLVFAIRPPRRVFTRALAFFFSVPAFFGGLFLVVNLHGPFRLLGLGYLVAAPVSVVRTVSTWRGHRRDAPDQR
jgi:hypothetical protein